MKYIDSLIKIAREQEKDKPSPHIPVSTWEFEAADRAARIPFDSGFVSGAVITRCGLGMGVKKPSERYSVQDSEALARIRARKAEKFKAMVWANEAVEESFNATMGDEEQAISGIRASDNTAMRRAGT